MTTRLPALGRSIVTCLIEVAEDSVPETVSRGQTIVDDRCGKAR
jgi:hypothetical protein